LTIDKDLTNIGFVYKKTEFFMSRICEVTGKAGLVGNMVSHSNRKQLMKQLPNLQKKRFYIPEEDRWVTLRVSAAGIREISKRGIQAVGRDLGK
jgi:large subunit ribosomal protein L28